MITETLHLGWHMKLRGGGSFQQRLSEHGQHPGSFQGLREESVCMCMCMCVCVCMCVHECLCTGTYHTQLLITKQGSTSPRPVVLWILMPLPGDKAGTQGRELCGRSVR